MRSSLAERLDCGAFTAALKWRTNTPPNSSLLGVDHERLMFMHQGRRFRLTDVHGKVVEDLIA